MCSQLRALYESLQAAAQACDPQIQGQCSATTNGPCCPLTVGVADRSAIDDFDQAVAMYKAQCSPDCSMSICQPAPSNACEPVGAKGTCR
jgi:hypothetical protein